jgi:hypothetical protein
MTITALLAILWLTEADLKEFGFDKNIRIKQVSDKMKEYHRNNIFE